MVTQNFNPRAWRRHIEKIAKASVPHAKNFLERLEGDFEVLAGELASRKTGLTIITEWVDTDLSMTVKVLLNQSLRADIELLRLALTPESLRSVHLLVDNKNIEGQGAYSRRGRSFGNLHLSDKKRNLTRTIEEAIYLGLPDTHRRSLASLLHPDVDLAVSEDDLPFVMGWLESKFGGAVSGKGQTAITTTRQAYDQAHTTPVLK